VDPDECLLLGSSPCFVQPATCNPTAAAAFNATAGRLARTCTCPTDWVWSASLNRCVFPF
jgi:hypothetical protein